MTYENYNKNYMTEDKIIHKGGSKISQDKRTWTNYWQPDSTSDTCTICNKKFSLSVRKHHCRFGGELMCDKCSITISHITFYFKENDPVLDDLNKQLAQSNEQQENIILDQIDKHISSYGPFRICIHHYDKFFKVCRSCNKPISKDDISSLLYKPCIHSLIWPIHKECIPIERKKYTDCEDKITRLLTSIGPLIYQGFDKDIDDYFSPIKNPNIKTHTFTGALYSHQNKNRHPFLSIPISSSNTFLTPEQLSQIYGELWVRVTPTAEHISTWIYLDKQFTNSEFNKLKEKEKDTRSLTTEEELDLKIDFLKVDDLEKQSDFITHLTNTRLLVIEHYKQIIKNHNLSDLDKFIEFIKIYEGLDTLVDYLMKAPQRSEIWDKYKTKIHSQLEYDEEDYYTRQDIDESDFMELIPWHNNDIDDAMAKKSKRLNKIAGLIIVCHKISQFINKNPNATFTEYLSIEQDGSDIKDGKINSKRIHKYSDITISWLLTVSNCTKRKTEDIFTKEEINSLTEQKIDSASKEKLDILGEQIFYIKSAHIKVICEKDNIEQFLKRFNTMTFEKLTSK